MKVLKTIISLIMVLSLSACMAGLNNLNESGSNLESDGEDSGGSNNGTDETYITFTGQSFPEDGTDNIVLDYGAIGIVIPDGIVIDADSVTLDTFILTGVGNTATSISPATAITGNFNHSYEFECDTGPCTGLAFIPSENLPAGTEFSARLVSGENGIRGINGERLEEDIVWSFKTPDLYFAESYPNSKFHSGNVLSSGKTIVTGYKDFDGMTAPWFMLMEQDGSIYDQVTDPFADMDGAIYPSIIHDGILYAAGIYGERPLDHDGANLWVGAYDVNTLEQIIRVTGIGPSDDLRPVAIAISNGNLYVAGRRKDLNDGFIYEFDLEDLSLTNTYFRPFTNFHNIIPYENLLILTGDQNTNDFIFKMDLDFNITDSSTHPHIDDPDGRIYRVVKLYDDFLYAVGAAREEDDGITGLIVKIDPSDLSVVSEYKIADYTYNIAVMQGLHDVIMDDDNVLYVAGSTGISGNLDEGNLIVHGFVGKYTTNLTELDRNTFSYNQYTTAERIAVDDDGCVKLYGFGVDPPNVTPFQMKLDSNLNIGGGTINLE